MKNKTNAVRLLDQQAIPYRLVAYDYDPKDLDVARIARDNGLELAQVYKTLVCKGDRTGPLVAVVPGDRLLDLKKLAAASGNKKCALLEMSALLATTGYQRGGCSPLGMKKDLPTYLDERAGEWPEILVNAGAKGLLMGLAPDDLEEASGLRRADLSKEAAA